MKRFIFSLPLEICLKLKKKAFSRNISMAKYVLEALIFRLQHEEE
jgi:hypothetical protein